MESVINHYQQLATVTSQMRQAAKQSEWDHLLELEQQCKQLVALIKQLDSSPINEHLRLQKMSLIHKILADDTAIRDYTQPWMSKLQHMMNSSRSEQKVQQAYSNNL